MNATQVTERDHLHLPARQPDASSRTFVEDLHAFNDELGTRPRLEEQTVPKSSRPPFPPREKPRVTLPSIKPLLAEVHGRELHLEYGVPSILRSNAGTHPPTLNHQQEQAPTSSWQSSTLPASVHRTTSTSQRSPTLIEPGAVVFSTPSYNPYFPTTTPHLQAIQVSSRVAVEAIPAPVTLRPTSSASQEPYPAVFSMPANNYYCLTDDRQNLRATWLSIETIPAPVMNLETVQGRNTLSPTRRQGYSRGSSGARHHPYLQTTRASRTSRSDSSSTTEASSRSPGLTVGSPLQSTSADDNDDVESLDGTELVEVEDGIPNSDGKSQKGRQKKWAAWERKLADAAFAKVLKEKGWTKDDLQVRQKRTFVIHTTWSMINDQLDRTLRGFWNWAAKNGNWNLPSTRIPKSVTEVKTPDYKAVEV
ncbi:hypothetical protein FRB90_002614 [Tulasnella sp. 427]|nr:hypothetical protein FRB90_002614 [Tulasnella sp. 427]